MYPSTLPIASPADLDPHVAPPRSERLACAGPNNVAVAIDRSVRERTGGRVSDLRVIVSPCYVILHGRCSTYYMKQLAQHAAMSLAGESVVVNDIQVTGRF